MSRWSEPADVRASVRKEWDSGRLLAARVPVALDAGPPGTPFPLRIAVRRPTTRDLTSRFDEARSWAAALNGGKGYRVESATLPHRVLGPQSLPQAVWIDSIDDAVRLIGKGAETRRFDRLVAATPASFLPTVAAKPHAVLDAAGDWPAILAVAEWLVRTPMPGIYLRQVDLPGVHTKVVEAHRRLIAALVDGVRPSPTTSGAGWFERRFGFRTKPPLLRYRALDPDRAPVPGLSDVTLPLTEFAGLAPDLQRVFVTENEMNLLSFPDQPGAIVIFGSGNEAPELLGGVEWLQGLPVHYWGDIDTHGFAILDRVRARLPHARSLLMDMQTLTTHRSSWVVEPVQVRRDLPRLSDAEASVYAALCESVLGDRVRLEQERVSFGHLLEQLAQIGSATA